MLGFTQNQLTLVQIDIEGFQTSYLVTRCISKINQLKFSKASLFFLIFLHTHSLSIYLNFPFLLSFLISSMDVFFYLSKPSLFTPKAYFIAFQGERKKNENDIFSLPAHRWVIIGTIAKIV